MPNPSHVRRHKGLWRHTLDQLLLVDLIRFAVTAIRYLWFVRVRGRLQTYDLRTGTNSPVAINTISHNLRGLRDLAVIRSHQLVRPLSVLEALPVDAQILSIGPRSEGELFNLAAHGFLLSHVRGLDLISYSPRVELGDMHAMQFADNSFDAVILGWVLAYSEDPVRAAGEVGRVTKPGGVVAVGVEYNPRAPDDIARDLGYLPGAHRRINSCDEILGLFGNAVDHVYYKHVVAGGHESQVGSFCVIFSIKREQDPGAQFDRLP